ncbi:hypothetical protein [Pantoea sp.]|uniref:hypothetical protein n=1 Tax=Pantoea sp. TaxID=69393 RepID=UPI0031CF98F6
MSESGVFQHIQNHENIVKVITRPPEPEQIAAPPPPTPQRQPQTLGRYGSAF